VLENGRSALAGSAAALRARDDVQALYLGGAARPSPGRPADPRVRAQA
jgi:branched-chain amino acid transport system ATP-binding protein